MAGEVSFFFFFVLETSLQKLPWHTANKYDLTQWGIQPVRWGGC